MFELSKEELYDISGGSLTLVGVGLISLAAGVIIGVEVADYYLE